MILLKILLFVLKLLGIVLLCLIGLLILISFLPVGVTAEYSADGPEVLALAGPVKLRLYPRRGGKRPKKEKKKKDKKAEPTESEAVPKPKRKLGGLLPLFRELLGLLLEMQASLRNRIKIRELILHLTVGGAGSDPAKSAILYGRAWAAIGNVMPRLMQAFRIGKRDVGAEVDFLSDKTTVYARATARVTVGSLLRMGLWYGLRGLKIYRRHKKAIKQARSA